MPTPDPNLWLLDNSGYWGTGTDMASRTTVWDTNCTVTPLIGGYAAMDSIRQTLETVIGEAAGQPIGQRGYVYIAGWRLDPVRDLSSGNSWGTTSAWPSGATAGTDETAIGLLLRLLDAGVKLRILVWCPTTLDQNDRAGGPGHFLEHFYLYSLVQQKSLDMESEGYPAGLGIVGLDSRVGAMTGTHHQKMMVIRGAGPTQVAYCGGVDLAFTRRDAPATLTSSTPQFNSGDWQSGAGMPNSGTWPKQAGFAYPTVTAGSIPNQPLPTDLPNGQPLQNIYGTNNQIWHDQHLMLQGPIVVTLEQQFRERWVDPVPTGSVSTAISPFLQVNRNFIYISDESARASDGSVSPLDAPASLGSSAGAGTSTVQMWRTIPVRNRGSSPALFPIGEFSTLSGIANACSQATQLIWIFDQYFWSIPLAAQLNAALLDLARPDLCVIIILPPSPDVSIPGGQCYLRNQAFVRLTANAPGTTLFKRLGLYNLWHPTRTPGGVYVHAKVQMYDGALLVCGSCNLNQRSLLCDTEIDCAVLDPTVVHDHQVNLWQLLFPSPIEGIEAQLGQSLDLSASGAGSTFFNLFTAAAVSSGSFLIEDPYYASIAGHSWSPPANGWQDRPMKNAAFGNGLGFVPDPTSLGRESLGPDPTLQEISNNFQNDSPTNPVWRK